MKPEEGFGLQYKDEESYKIKKTLIMVLIAVLFGMIAFQVKNAGEIVKIKGQLEALQHLVFGISMMVTE